MVPVVFPVHRSTDVQPPHANNPTCPPVCQNSTVWSGVNRSSRTYAISAPSAFAVYV